MRSRGPGTSALIKANEKIGTGRIQDRRARLLERMSELQTDFGPVSRRPRRSKLALVLQPRFGSHWQPRKLHPRFHLLAVIPASAAKLEDSGSD